MRSLLCPPRQPLELTCPGVQTKMGGESICRNTYCVLGPQLNVKLDLHVLCYLTGGSRGNLFSIGSYHVFLFMFIFFNDKKPY